MSNVQDFDFSVDLLRALLWQDNSAPILTSLLTQKQDWYDENVTQFWEDWIANVFDVRTANEFGLAVWAIILGVPTTVILPPTTKKNFGFGLLNYVVDPTNANGDWSTSTGTITTGYSDPNGGTQGVELALTGATPSVTAGIASGGIPSGTVTVSFKAKLVSGTQGTINSSVGGTSIGNWPVLTPGVWTTVTLTGANSSSGTTSFQLVSASGASAPTIAVWGVRLCASTETDNGKLNFNRGNFGINNSTPANLTLDQKRILILLRYFQITCLPSVSEINAGLKRILGDQGNIYVLDPLNMTFVTYVFGFQPNSALAFVLNNYDILPRPSAVGVRYVVATRPTFGFGPYNKNFNNGNFGS
jgi:hypothetical protein